MIVTKYYSDLLYNQVNSHTLLFERKKSCFWDGFFFLQKSFTKLHVVVEIVAQPSNEPCYPLLQFHKRSRFISNRHPRSVQVTNY